MRVGLFVPLVSPVCDRAYTRAVGSFAEECGFHSLWVGEHVVMFDEYRSPYPYAADGKIPGYRPERGPLEPFTALAFLAGVTERIRLGTGICIVPQRNPVYTAKEASTVDWISGGRLDLGVGIGWLAEEFRAVDVPWERRAARCRSYLEVVKRLWCDPVSAYEDEFYELPACRQYPKPLQRPHPPIHFGGESDAALRRVADMGQGWYGIGLAPDAVASRLAVLDRLLAERGRSRAEVQVSVSPGLAGLDRDALARFRDAGADQLLLMLMPREPSRLRQAVESLAESVLEPAKRLG